MKISAISNGIDNILNKITMYRVVLYYLLLLFAAALVYSVFGILPYPPLMLLLSAIVLFAVAWAANNVFAHVFEAPANAESVYITAFILALIITPVKSIGDVAGLSFLGWAATLAMASKYILAIKKKHIFNPAAFAVALTAFAIGRSASWWAGGNLPMLPLVLLGGILLVRKITRFDLVLSFFVSALASSLYFGVARGTNILTVAGQALVHAPILFFAFVMLTEPLTTPPTRPKRICYGILTGLLFSPAVHIGQVYFTPELALLAGNIFAYLVSPKEKLILRLKEKILAANDTYDFIFGSYGKFNFQPGQYLEWTLGMDNADSRGNRRYFTVASSPTESDLRLGVKFYPGASAFKKKMLSMHPGEKIVASQLAGDFTLPRDKNKKLVFIAGGIGVTPFRSMVKYLLDKNEQRSIVLMYSNRTRDDIAYKDIFDEAGIKLGIKAIYTLTDIDAIPPGWSGGRGMITAEMIKNEIPDYMERTFYVSGPHAMTKAFEKTLKNMGVKRRNIVTDYFPGFA